VNSETYTRIGMDYFTGYTIGNIKSRGMMLVFLFMQSRVIFIIIFFNFNLIIVVQTKRLI